MINSDKLISVIIPVYNSSRYIRRCLVSILDNTYKKLEVICINDGSSDDSLFILNEFAEKDSRVIVLDQSNGGVSSARNLGLKRATGDYIAFVDSDDWVHNRYFELLYEAIEKADLSHCDMYRINEDNYEDEAIEKADLYIVNTEDDIIRAFTSHCWGKLFRKSVIEGLFFEEGIDFGEDKLFTSLAIQRVHNVSVIRNKLYYYYNNAESAVNTIENNMYPVAEKFYEDALKNGNILSLKYAFTGFLSYRYMSMFKQNASEIRKDCNYKLDLCIRLAKDMLHIKDYLILTLLVRFEWIYRTYRILEDRNLLNWEKEQKYVNKENGWNGTSM